jgi:hypothetical protein
MKIINKITGGLLLILITITFSCNKEKPQFGYLTVKMTDTPLPFKEVNADITGLEVYQDGAGWVSLPVVNGVYNLLDFKDKTITMVNHAPIGRGKISEARIILGNNNSIVTTDGQRYVLEVPPGTNTSVKIDYAFAIPRGHTLTVTIDFDAEASIINDNGKYTIKPVIRIKSVSLL